LSLPEEEVDTIFRDDIVPGAEGSEGEGIESFDEEN